MNSVLIWEETGKPRSMGGAFDVLYTARHVAPPELTLGELYAKRNREAAQSRRDAHKARLAAVQLHSLSGKSKAKAQTAKVLRNNVGSAFCYPIGTQADAGKTARIQGKPL
jgi:hypothetical protein